MPVDTDAEILRLRAGLRDLVALSTIPVTWVGREPRDVAGGLADALIGLLQLDVAAVRLCDPGGAGAVQVIRGDVSTTLREWLERRLATNGRLSAKEIFPDVGGGEEPYRGVVIPIGVDAEGGVVAVACDRIDFPTEIDQLLLSLAANHAATAFQAARLIHERRMAEEELREARNDLQIKVAERTAELRRSRDELRQLAEEQAALRRVATRVAQTVSPSEVFESVTREVGQLCRADLAHMERYEPDGTVTGVAAWSRSGDRELAVGTRFALEGLGIAALARQTCRPVRVDSFADGSGPIAQEARALGIRASVGCPIVVEGRLWGVIAASSRGEAQFPAGTESQLAAFTQLVATAIANAESRGELIASRARVVAAADDARRQVVRDLHDGAQQRLVHTIITLKLAERALHNEDESLPALLTEALGQAERANVELREIAHGILPAVLARGGMRAGVDALAARMPVPVENAVAVGRLPDAVEATAYFVVAEALTNVAKHSGAHSAAVKAWVEDRALHLEVRDDGMGGARPGGTGLVGLADRLAAVGGRLQVVSPPNGGTLIDATLPLPV